MGEFSALPTQGPLPPQSFRSTFSGRPTLVSAKSAKWRENSPHCRDLGWSTGGGRRERNRGGNSAKPIPSHTQFCSQNLEQSEEPYPNPKPDQPQRTTHKNPGPPHRESGAPGRMPVSDQCFTSCLPWRLGPCHRQRRLAQACRQRRPRWSGTGPRWRPRSAVRSA